jgi:hypothetical protein
MSLFNLILISLVILFVVYLILQWYSGNSTQLSKSSNAQDQKRIVASTIPVNNNSNNYTYSTWFYVNDWNYSYGESKILLARNDADNNPGPSIVLGAMKNDITVSVTCYSTSDESTQASDNHVIHNCTISNFPIQKWVNLIVSLYGRTLDVYLDGKLVRTCVLPGVAKVNKNSDIFITPKGGFSGMTSNIKYWSDATNPQEAYEIYKDGFGGTKFGKFLNKYKLKISFLQDNKEKGSFEI